MPIKGVGVVETKGNIVCWKIPSLTILSQPEGTRIWSPVVNEYPFSSSFTWHAEVPKGSIGLRFGSTDLKNSLSKCVQFGVADETETEINSCYGEWIITGSCLFYPQTGYFKVKELCKLDSWNKCIGRKHIFCEVIKYGNLHEGNASTKTENVYETDEVTKTVSDIGSADNVMSQELKNLRKLSENLQELYAGEKHADVTIKVKEREFKVHKAIITARSSVFDAMFAHELSESNTGLVPIEDCEPNIFEEFLFFVYTGKIRQHSSENVCELYYVADKYQVLELKEECVNFLKKSLTIESICDVICLSTKCNESDLLDLATTFFERNMEEILVTVKWQQFLSENPTEANELTIKSLKLGFTKRKI